MKENKKSIKDSLWPIKRVRDSFQEDDQKVNKYYLNRMYQLKYYYNSIDVRVLFKGKTPLSEYFLAYT